MEYNFSQLKMYTGIEMESFYSILHKIIEKSAIPRNACTI